MNKNYFFWRMLHISIRPLAYVVGILWLVVLPANSSDTWDFGVHCVDEVDGRLVAFAGDDYYYGPAFVSADGGASWQSYQNVDRSNVDCPPDLFRDSVFELIDQDNNIRYRFTIAQSIDSSTDGGQTWIQEVGLPELSQEVRRSYHHQKDISYGIVITRPGPFDALIHRSTGNLVVAMGHDGILLRTPGGEWQWVAVGPYYLADIAHLDMLIPILSGELGLAAVLGILLLVSILPIGKSTQVLSARIVSWFLWGILVILPPSSWSPGALIASSAPIMACFFPFIALLVIIAVIETPWGSPALLVKAGLFSVVGIMLFLLPYVLWSQGIIPRHLIASLFSLVLPGSVLIAWRMQQGKWKQRRDSS